MAKGSESDTEDESEDDDEEKDDEVTSEEEEEAKPVAKKVTKKPMSTSDSDSSISGSKEQKVSKVTLNGDENHNDDRFFLPLLTLMLLLKRLHQRQQRLPLRPSRALRPLPREKQRPRM